ncbi:MAG TPA: hypothetical protein PKD19_02635 [Candidatus Saccharibacteria bacterium]|nr:hypothetical protein [Candidatus Saccharibacteria bacterium]HMR38532.1 hypothetical protein [Candidatus Saccharibacteria bacterium]
MKKQSSTGFTIIEVVLVLAIAALIFLMVFVALPTLQRNQRDSERKTDAGIVSTAVTDFVSSNRRALKSDTTDQTSLQGFISKMSQYEAKNVVLQGSASTSSEKPGTTENGDPVMWVHVGGKCEGQGSAKGTTRQAAVRITLENGNVYCVDAAS